MPTRELLIFIALMLAAAGIVVAAVTVYQRSHHQPDAPTAHVAPENPGSSKAPAN